MRTPSDEPPVAVFTPVPMLRMPAKLRRARGRSVTVFMSNVCCCSGDTVFTNWNEASTEIVSLLCPTSSVYVCRMLCPAPSWMPVSRYVLNPGSSIEMVYVPARTKSNWKSPVSVVVFVVTVPVSCWVKFTVTPGILAELASITVPYIVAVVTCARIGAATATHTMNVPSSIGNRIVILLWLGFCKRFVSWCETSQILTATVRADKKRLLLHTNPTARDRCEVDSIAGYRRMRSQV